VLVVVGEVLEPACHVDRLLITTCRKEIYSRPDKKDKNDDRPPSIRRRPVYLAVPPGIEANSE
jgi:hypothetical protein